nr:Rieske 2Fe-2S domain-containing protein [Malikia spinosa]
MERQSIKPVRLLGEDLVLFKDLGGQYGLTDRHCAHRRADLSYGFVEAEGIRCNYHGWQFNAQGACVAAPFEDRVDPQSKLRQQVRLKAYPVRAKAGLLWAYLGPQPAPELPDWEPFHWSNGFVQAVFPRCRATGCKPRKTRSTRCISNGCMPTGAAACAAMPAAMPPATCNWRSRNSSMASSTSASRKIPTTSIRCGPSGGSACGPTASSWATISNGGYRWMTRTRSA